MNELIGCDDPDIGRCDLCGSEDGRRHRSVVAGSEGGRPVRYVAWLCGPCRRERKAVA